MAVLAEGPHERVTGAAPAGDLASAWMMPPAAAGRATAAAAGLDRLRELLDQDPMLGSIDRAWNANPLKDVIPVDWAEVVRALRTVWLRRMADPARALPAMAELNVQMARSAVEAWNDAAARWWGLGERRARSPARASRTSGSTRRNGTPTRSTARSRTSTCWRRTSSWRRARPRTSSPPSASGCASTWSSSSTRPARRSCCSANPAALRRAMETGGASIADGARNLLRDLKEGRLTMVDPNAFAPGRNLAITPGKVVFRNRLIELIQYAPQTEKVHEVPLLFIPPWINKFYILDMQPKNSFVRYLVEQGFTVFVISWKNPDASMEEHHLRGLHARRPACGRRGDPGDHRQPDGEPGRLLHRRHAAGA